jgi:HlyD family secretion protein
LAEAQLASADANVARLETDLANLDARLEDAVLSAPFDGVVAVLNASVGDAVGSQPVATVADPTRLRVRAAFDENRAGELAVDLPGDVVPDADTALRLPARVTRLSPVAAREGGGAQVEVLLDFLDDDAETRVRPGYTVTARVRVAEADDVLRIPLEALSEDEDGATYLFLVEALPDDPDRAAVRRVDVATIERNATVAAVDPATVSFGTDDRIAVVGIDDLQDGDEVRVASAGARAP